tara:strand:- start:4213 stop:5085 length:873 start_codon:yes stop_codon:yes gene_type:complete
MKISSTNTVSVVKGSNKIISSSEDNWNGLKKGSSIRIAKDQVFYEVASIEKIMPVESFSKSGQDHIVSIPIEDVQLFQTNDQVKLSYKEYGVSTIIKVLSPGKGFSQGDILTTNLGNPSFDTETGMASVLKFKVISCEGGKIKNVSIESPGKYLNVPDSVIEIAGGTGKGAIFELGYKVLNVRSFVERQIAGVGNDVNKAHLVLNMDLPRGVSDGKISTEKWKITLSSNYAGETNLSTGYEIVKDFAPHSTIPLMSPNSSNPDMVYNLGMRRIAKRLYDLEQKFKNLELG